MIYGNAGFRIISKNYPYHLSVIMGLFPFLKGTAKLY